MDGKDKQPLSVWDVTAQAEKDFGIPDGLLRGLGMEESYGLNQYDENGNTITSPTGPRGAFQFTKKTARQMGINRDDPIENVLGAAKLMKQNYSVLRNQLDDEHEAWIASAVAHNRGLGAVQGMIKNRRFTPGGKDSGNGGDTRTYATKILNNWADLRGKNQQFYTDQSGEVRPITGDGQQQIQQPQSVITPGAPTLTPQITPEESAAFDARFPKEIYSPTYVEPQPLKTPEIPQTSGIDLNALTAGVDQLAQIGEASKAGQPYGVAQTPNEAEYQKWLSTMEGYTDTPERRAEYQAALGQANQFNKQVNAPAIAQDTAAMDAWNANRAKELSTWQQQQPAAVQGMLSKPLQFGKPNDNLNTVAGQWKPENAKDDRDAAIQAMSAVGRHYGITPEQAAKYVDSLAKPLESKWEPGTTVQIGFNDIAKIKGENETKTDIRMEQAQAQPGLVTPQELHVGENFIKQDADWLNKNAGAALKYFNPLLDYLPDALKNNIASSIAGGIIGSGGSTADAVGGIASALNSLPLPSIADYGDLQKKLQEVSETSKQFEKETGDGGIVSQLFKVAGRAPGDVSRLVLFSRLPGGAWAALPADMGLQAAGRGENAWSIAKEAGKGLALAGVLKAAPYVGAVTGALSAEGQTARRAIDEITTLGTITGGTYAVERLTGSSDEQATQSALVMALFHLANQGVNLSGKTVRGRDAQGNEVNVRVDPDGSVKLLKGQVEAPDVEMYFNQKSKTWEPKNQAGAPVPAERSAEPVANLRENNPTRIEVADPTAVQKAQVDTRVRKVTDALKNETDFVDIDALAKKTRLNRTNVEDAVMTLYGARMVEMLPGNKIKLIDPTEVAKQTDLYNKAQNYGQTPPEVPQPAAPVAPQASVPPAETTPSQPSVEPQTQIEPQPQAQAQPVTQPAADADNIQPPIPYKQMSREAADKWLRSRSDAALQQINDEIVPSLTGRKKTFEQAVRNEVFRRKTEKTEQEWQKKVTDKLAELEGNIVAKNSLGGRDPKMMTTGQLKTLYGELERIKPVQPVEPVASQETAVSEPQTAKPQTDDKQQLVELPEASDIPFVLRGGSGHWEVYHADSDTIVGAGKTRQQAIDSAGRSARARGNLFRIDLGLEGIPEFYHNGRPVIVYSRGEGTARVRYLDGKQEVVQVKKADLSPVTAAEPAKAPATAEPNPTARPTKTKPPKHQSLSQFVRSHGGIRGTNADRGEHRRISNKETGTTGLINKNSAYTAEHMAEIAWEAGYLRDEWPTSADRDGMALMGFVESDLTGEKKYYALEAFEDFDRDLADKEAEYYAERDRQAEAADEYRRKQDDVIAKQTALLQDPEARQVLAKVAEDGYSVDDALGVPLNEASNKFQDLLDQYGIEHGFAIPVIDAYRLQAAFPQSESGSDTGVARRESQSANETAAEPKRTEEPRERVARPTLHGVPPQELDPVLRARILYAKERKMTDADIAERYNLTPEQVASVGTLPEVGQTGQMSFRLIQGLTPSKTATPEEVADKVAKVNDLVSELGLPVENRVTRNSLPGEVKTAVDAIRLAIAKEMGAERASHLTPEQWLKWLDTHADSLEQETVGTILEALGQQIEHSEMKVAPFIKDKRLERLLVRLDEVYDLEKIDTLDGIPNRDIKRAILELAYEYGIKATAAKRAFETARKDFLEGIRESPDTRSVSGRSGGDTEESTPTQVERRSEETPELAKSVIPNVSPYTGTTYEGNPTQLAIANAWRLTRDEHIKIRLKGIVGLAEDIARNNAIQDHEKSVKYAVRNDFYGKAIKAGEMTPAQAERAIRSIGNKLPQFVTAYLADLQSNNEPLFARTKTDDTWQKRVQAEMDAVKEVRNDAGRLLAPNGEVSNLSEHLWKAVRTPSFLDFFGDWINDPKNASQVVDENGEPKVLYSGHANIERYDRYNPKAGVAGGFYATEDPEVSSGYALGKRSPSTDYEDDNPGLQYRFKQKNGKFEKKIWQIHLTPEQQDIARRIIRDEYGYDIEEYWKDNKPYDKYARQALMRGGLRDPQSIYRFLENMGNNIVYVDHQDPRPYFEKQQKSAFEEILDAVGIEWQSLDHEKPGTLPVFLNIRNPLTNDGTFPADVLKSLKSKASRVRESDRPDHEQYWTKELPMREWVSDIERGDQFWSTAIPQKALPILQNAGYDGVKEWGNKGAENPAERQANWIAFEPTQIKSIFNRGTWDKNEDNILFARTKQIDQTETPEFKAWFGDSKMVDESGKPIIAFHGTNSEFDTFRSDVGHANDRGFYGKGHYFTFNRDAKWQPAAKGEAGYYGEKIMPVYLKIEKPFDMSKLSEYRGTPIHIVGSESLVFLSNLAKEFPELAKNITLDQYGPWEDGTRSIVGQMPISELPALIEKYRKQLKTYTGEDSYGRTRKYGYVKSETVSYTDADGNVHSWERNEDLSPAGYEVYDSPGREKEIEIGMIAAALEKYEGVEPEYHPEGYMTRNPDITDAIKAKGYDGIVQSMHGDEAVVFEPTQIKSVDNVGDYNPSDPNIYHAKTTSIPGQVDLFGNATSLHALQQDLFGDITPEQGAKAFEKRQSEIVPEKTFQFLSDMRDSSNKDIAKNANALMTLAQDAFSKDQAKIVEDAADALDIYARSLSAKTTVANMLRQGWMGTDVKLSPQAEKFAEAMEKGTMPKAMADALGRKDTLFMAAWRFRGLDERPSIAKDEPGVLWHGSDNADLRGGTTGLHIGTYEAAKQALEARIGVPAEGEWDGTREYGKTLLMGTRRLDALAKQGIYKRSGYNADAPDEDYYPIDREKRAKYSDGTPVPFDAVPIIEPVRITGKMTNSRYTPRGDWQANGLMRRALKQGNARSGFYYKNEAEDSGSISAVVPDESFLERLYRNVGAPIEEVLFNKAQTSTPEFKRWFKDSKVVDENGKPLVVYHGTKADFDTFDKAKGGSETGSAAGREGFFFTDKPQVASAYPLRTLFGMSMSDRVQGANVVPAYLSLQNPLIVQRVKRSPSVLDENYKDLKIFEAKEAGHDGIIFRDFIDSPESKGGRADVYMAFEPTQIKSAIGNNGNFDPNDPRITFNKSALDAESKKLNSEFIVKTNKAQKQKGGAANIITSAKISISPENRNLIRVDTNGLILAHSLLRQSGWTGATLPSGAVMDVKGALGRAYMNMRYDGSEDAAKAIERLHDLTIAATDRETGAVAFSLYEPKKYPVTTKYSGQEESGHLADFKTEARYTATMEAKQFKEADPKAYEKARKAILDQGYSERVAHREFLGKLQRDDATDELNLTAAEVETFQIVRDEQLIEAGMTPDEALDIYGSISKSNDKRLTSYANKYNLKNGSRADQSNEPGDTALSAVGQSGQGQGSGAQGQTDLAREADRPDREGLRLREVPDNAGGLNGKRQTDVRSTGDTADTGTGKTTRDDVGAGNRAIDKLNEFDRKWIEQKAAGNTALQKSLATETLFAKDRKWGHVTVNGKTYNLAKTKEVPLDILNSVRAVKSSVDLSAAGRQGAIVAVNHPILAANAFVKQVSMLPPRIGAKNYAKFKRDLDLHPFIELAQESKLHLTSLGDGSLHDKEEAFMTRLLGDDPYFQNKKLETTRKALTFPVRTSERAYVTFLDDLRINTFAKLAKEIHAYNVRKGQPDDIDQYKGIASFINKATGRGDLGRFEDAAPILGTVFFSPRYWASRLQVLNPAFYAKLPPGARKIAIREMLVYLGAVAGLMALLKAAGFKVEMGDEKNPDLIKLRLGNYSYDFTAGLIGHLRYAARMVMALGDKDPTSTMSYLTERYLRSKLAPIPAGVVNTVQGKNFIGEPTSAKEEALGLFQPIMVDNFKDAAKAEGVAGLLKMSPEFFGISTTRYRQPDEYYKEIQNEKAKLGDNPTPAQQQEYQRRATLWKKLADKSVKFRAKEATTP